MASVSGRTLVCSVLFLDIAGYSRLDVTEQVRLKQTFNKVMSEALESVEPAERVVIDTGDGAAVAFLGDPERALYVGLGLFDSVGELPVRMGINLGPVSLMKDINDADNVIGDGINVAQRIMAFAGAGELLVSRSFYEVVSRLSADYASMFSGVRSHTDKHERAHEVYALSQAVRVGRRVAEAQARLKGQRLAAPETDRRAPVDRTPAQVFDAGTHYMISGYSEESVRASIEGLLARGCKLKSPPTLIGRKWIASVDNPRASGATVQELGFKRIVCAPTREAVDVAVHDLIEKGAVLVQGPDLEDGVWTAVCERT